MDFGVPWDLIREAQSLRRKEAGLSSYDPEDPNLPNLPSVKESLAHFDPSAAELRCEHCKARLIRGSDSVVCVYCGSLQNRDTSPEPIAFKSTVAYRWLLETLNLNGSEIVEVPIEDGESKTWNRKSRDVTVSELLDLEIKWPKDIVTFENTLLSQELLRSDLSGLDMEEIFQVREESSALEKVQTYDVEESSSSKDALIDSGWHADFQFASFQQLEDPVSLNHSEGSISISSVNADTSGVGKDKNAEFQFASFQQFEDPASLNHSEVSISISSVNADILGVENDKNADFFQQFEDPASLNHSEGSVSISSIINVDTSGVGKDKNELHMSSNMDEPNRSEANADSSRVNLFENSQWQSSNSESLDRTKTAGHDFSAIDWDAFKYSTTKESKSAYDPSDSWNVLRDSIGTQNMSNGETDGHSSIDLFSVFQDSLEKDMPTLENSGQGAKAEHNENEGLDFFIGETSVTGNKKMSDDGKMLDSWDVLGDSIGTRSISDITVLENGKERNSLDAFGSFQDSSYAETIPNVYGDIEGMAAKHDLNEDLHTFIIESSVQGSGNEEKMADDGNSLDAWDVFRDSVGTQSIRNHSSVEIESTAKKHTFVDFFGSFCDSSDAKVISNVGDGMDTAKEHDLNESEGDFQHNGSGKKMNDDENSLDIWDVFGNSIGTQSMSSSKNADYHSSADAFGLFQDSVVYGDEGRGDIGRGLNGNWDAFNGQISVKESSEKKMATEKSFPDAWDIFRDSSGTHNTSIDSFAKFYGFEGDHNSFLGFSPFQDSKDACRKEGGNEDTSLSHDLNGGQDAATNSTSSVGEKKMAVSENSLSEWDDFKDSTREGGVEGVTSGHHLTDVWDSWNASTVSEDGGEKKMTTERHFPSTRDVFRDSLATNVKTSISRKCDDDMETFDEDQSSPSEWDDFKDSTTGQNVPDIRNDSRQNKVIESDGLFDAWDAFRGSAGTLDMPNASSRGVDLREETDHKDYGYLDVWGAFQVSTSARQEQPDKANSMYHDTRKAITDDFDSFGEWDVFQAASSAQNM